MVLFHSILLLESIQLINNSHFCRIYVFFFFFFSCHVWCLAILYPPVLKNNDIQNRESCPQDKKKKSDLHEDCPSLVQMVE